MSQDDFSLVVREDPKTTQAEVEDMGPAEFILQFYLARLGKGQEPHNGWIEDAGRLLAHRFQLPEEGAAEMAREIYWDVVSPY